MKREERYEVVAQLQDGAVATTFRARDQVLDRPVLLKVLHPGLAGSKEGVQRFRREALLQARLKHPHIVTIYDFGSADDLYIASEFVFGVTLEQKLKERGRLTLDEFRPIILQVVDALSYAHRKGVVHRDLKPGNIMIADSGEVKLTDFGLAFAPDLGHVTQEGVVLGTPAYMSPEQARGEATDRRTDIFSLGVIIYHALSGVSPFRARTFAATLGLTLNHEPEPLDAVAAGVSHPVSELTARMLAKDRSRRLADLEEVKRAFSGPETLPRRLPRRPGVRAVFAAALAIIAVVAVMLVLHRSRAPGQTREPGALSAAPGLAAAAERGPGQGPVVAGRDSPAAGADSVAGLSPSRAAPRAPKEPVLAGDGHPAVSRVMVEVTPWAEIVVDGEVRGTTPLAEHLTLRRGRHSLMLRNPGFPPLSRDVAILDSLDTLRFDLSREFSRVEINVIPWALIAVDGVFVDTTPLAQPIPLALGEHTITLTHPELGTREERIHLDSVGAYRFSFDLTRRQAR